MKTKIKVLSYSTVFLSVLLTGLFIFSGNCYSATIFTDNFESYDLGLVYGQGGWITSPKVFVQSDSVKEGDKALEMFDLYYVGLYAEKQGELVNDGQITVYFSASNIMYQMFNLILKEGNEERIELRFVQGQAQYFDGTRYVVFGAYGPGSLYWYAVQIQWRSSDHTARYNINSGIWSEWAPVKSPWVFGLDTLRLKNKDSWLRIDAIQEDLIGVKKKNPVLIVPGLMGSRLYEDGNRLWEPSSDSDVQELYLNSEGKSVNDNIIAQDIIDTFDGPLIFNTKIYKSLLSELKQRKSEGLISDYSVAPYDWRLSLPDILAEGSVESELRRIASESQTGKVDIIAHSNGGLLIKALVNKFGAEASNLIGQIILIAVPQIGTPQTIGALLHGYDAGIPLRFSNARARDLSRNMVAIYQLLPHSDYYEKTVSSINIPPITFKQGEATQQFIGEYGESITDAYELSRFLIGQEGRSAPDYEDLKNPDIVNETLLSVAEELAQTLGSSWQAPEGITVHQIAGVGESTLAGIEYKTEIPCEIFIFTQKLCLKRGEPKLIYTPELVVNGDKTVVVPSALAMNDDAENVNRWWVNLYEFNNVEKPYGNIPGFQFLRTTHKDILEIPQLRDFIFNNLLFKSSQDLPQYISAEMPFIDSEKHLRFILHSPLVPSAKDSSGNEVSEITANVLGASFDRYGETQTITIPSQTNPTLFLSGIDDGSFTLEIQEIENNSVIASASFSGIPSAPQTLAKISFPDGTVQNATDFEVDYDGDGSGDLFLAPIQGESVMFEDASLSDLLTVIREKIQSLEIKDKIKQNLLGRINNLEKKIAEKQEKNQKIIAKLEKEISKKVKSGKLDDLIANEIIAFLELLEVQSEEGVPLSETTLTGLKNAIINSDAKQNFKNSILKKVENLEKKQDIIESLSNLVANVTKKGEKENVNEELINEIILLLKQIELYL